MKNKERINLNNRKRKEGFMNKSKDVVMISDTDSEYIDKIILILNDNKKRIVSEEILLKQAEKIIYEYENKGKKKETSPVLKIVFLISACFLISLVTCFLSMQLF